MRGIGLLRLLGRTLKNSDNTGLLIAFSVILIIAVILILRSKLRK